MEATRLAGEQRLRPIIMTSLAFAVGCLPLAIAVGAGANARHSIGTGIIGGMIGETTLAMLYVPLFFYIFDRWARARASQGKASRSRRRTHRPRPPRPTRRRRRPPRIRLRRAPTDGARYAPGCAAPAIVARWRSSPAARWARTTSARQSMRPRPSSTNPRTPPTPPTRCGGSSSRTRCSTS